MFWPKNNKKTKKSQWFGFFWYKLKQPFLFFYDFLKPRRWRQFFTGQKKEIRQLSSGQETFKQFYSDSHRLLNNLFIPNENNGYRPKSLRPKSLLTYAFLAVALKFLVVGFLFFTYPNQAELSAIVSNKIISLINQSRIEAGVSPLVQDEILAKFAQEKGGDMIARNYFAHDTPEGKRPWQWINKGEYDYVYAGENLAMDFTEAEDVHDAFMKSPSHRKNILNEKYKDVGIAVLNGELDGHKTILLVEFFGTNRSEAANLAATKENVQVEEKTSTTTSVLGQALNQPEPVAQTPDINSSVSNQKVISVMPAKAQTETVVDLLIESSNIFFIALMIFLSISLIINIIVKIKIQHPAIILQSVVVIALIGAMLLVKFHFAENVASSILILSANL
ncbi:MAG: CAP domain-containing protein [Candidatus Buchananbacteria bacterium]